MFARVLHICSLLLLVRFAALGEDKYDLRLHMRQGQSWSFDQVFEERQMSHLSVVDHPPVVTEQWIRSVRKGQMSVLTVSNGVPTAVRVAFDPACAAVTERDGTPRTIDFPFAGVKVTIQRNATGRITEEFDPKLKNEPDPMQRRELEACLAGNDGRPARPVAVGEEWELDFTQIRQSYQLTDQDRVTGFSKLVSLTTLNGRRAAEVTNYTSITSRQGEMTLTEESKGRIWLDLETGALVRSSFDGNISTKGIRIERGLKGEPVRIEVDNATTNRMRLTTTPADTSAGAASPAPSPKPPNPLATNAPAEAPPLPPALEPWPGTYRDAQIVLELKTNAAGAFEGSILFKDLKLPVTARADRGGLKGEFRSGGEAFDFTATRDGRTVTLTTGGKTYQLKQQDINPLGGSPQ
jgi:hypothetical protein